MHTEYIDYADGKQPLEGYLAYDTAIQGKRPCVIVCHAWGGQDDFARGKAEGLAKLGYAGFALDMYGKGKRGSNNEENAKLMQPFMDDRALVARRLKAAAELVKQHIIVNPQQIGAIGFCFGGLCALDLARSGTQGVQGVVAFHSLLAGTKHGAAKITAKILALHGFDDPFAPPDAVLAFGKEMTDAKADWQLHMYGGTVHAFTNPQANMPDNGLLYNQRADRRSWQAMKDFFNEVFG